MLNKFCNKCKLEKPIDNFSKNINANDRLQYHCKACAQEVSRDKYKKNKESILKKNKIKRANNRAALSKMRKQYYLKNKGILCDNAKRYYYNNRDKISKKAKVRYLKKKELLKND